MILTSDAVDVNVPVRPSNKYLQRKKIQNPLIKTTEGCVIPRPCVSAALQRRQRHQRPLALRQVLCLPPAALRVPRPHLAGLGLAGVVPGVGEAEGAAGAGGSGKD